MYLFPDGKSLSKSDFDKKPIVNSDWQPIHMTTGEVNFRKNSDGSAYNVGYLYLDMSKNPVITVVGRQAGDKIIRDNTLIANVFIGDINPSQAEEQAHTDKFIGIGIAGVIGLVLFGLGWLSWRKSKVVV